MDMLLSTGEQVTISLLAMALQEKGYDAVSYTGWQAGVRTEAVHGNARITDIDITAIRSRLAEGRITVVAGFQGVTEDGGITTLGRGGSDTTAVALARGRWKRINATFIQMFRAYLRQIRGMSGQRENWREFLMMKCWSLQIWERVFFTRGRLSSRKTTKCL